MRPDAEALSPEEFHNDVMFLIENGLCAPRPSQVIRAAEAEMWRAAHPWRTRLERWTRGVLR